MKKLKQFFSDIPLAFALFKREGAFSFFKRTMLYFVGRRFPVPKIKARGDLSFYSQRHSYRDYLKQRFYSAYEKSPDFIPRSQDLFSRKDFDVKPIAFYFPQYHPFEENDRFWGKGFTEWTNVTKAQPVFWGHYQPRLPGELGFYDTRITDVLAQQIQIAKQYGIFGFCFHHYWFSGKPVMREPYNQIMSHPELDIPFCLHWANEPWTIRWDGFGDKGGVLLDQNHNPEDDMSFIRDIEPALRDRRYIRIDGRPLLIIYRPNLFPNIKETITRWNDYCQRVGIGPLYFAMMQTCFDNTVNPREYNFDAAIEYPPHNHPVVNVRDFVQLFDSHFSGEIFSYPDVMLSNIEKKKPEYTLFRGVIPDWDCTPRRRNPAIYIGSTPSLFQEWVFQSCRYIQQHFSPDKNFLFINAWNEWAEGAYLEPDRKYGFAYLEAIKKALILSRE